MKVTVEKRNQYISVNKMVAGQIAEVKSQNNFTWSGHILRTYSEFVLLEQPNVSWTSLRDTVLVEPLPEGTKITLVVE